MPPRTTSELPGTSVSVAATRPPVRLSAVPTVAPAARAAPSTRPASSSSASGEMLAASWALSARPPASSSPASAAAASPAPARRFARLPDGANPRISLAFTK